MPDSLQRLTRIGIALIVILPIATLLVPAPSGLAPWQFHCLLYITSFAAVTYGMAAVTFIRGLGGFSKQLRRGYIFFITGFSTIAAGYLHLAILPLLNASESWWVKYGMMGVPFLAGIACVYIGVRGFTKLFQVRSVFTSPLWTLLIAIAAAIASILLPQGTPNIPVDDVTLQASKPTQILPMMFAVAATVLAYKSRMRAGSTYIPALAWLYAYLLISVIGVVFSIVVRLIQPGSNAISDSGLGYIINLFAGLALFKSALLFNQIRYGRDTIVSPESQTFFGKPLDLSTGDARSVTDVLSYMAGFASSTTAIDPILDDMRVMTATRDPGAFNEREQQQLAHTYLALERYLSNEDPVRRYSKEELRTILQSRFSAVLQENPTFTNRVLG